jgi:hypothetical protein
LGHELSTGAGLILAANSYCIGKLCLAPWAAVKNAFNVFTQYPPHHDGLSAHGFAGACGQMRGAESKSWQPAETLLLLEQVLFLIVCTPGAGKSTGINEGEHDIELHVAGDTIGISVAIDAGIRPWIGQGIPVFQDCDLWTWTAEMTESGSAQGFDSSEYSYAIRPFFVRLHQPDTSRKPNSAGG